MEENDVEAASPAMSGPAALRRSLATGAEEQVLRVAWEAFTLAGELADAVAFGEDVDDIAALGLGAAADAGRGLVPPPADGAPVPLPQAPVGAVAPELAQLLDDLAPRLDGLARAATEPGIVAARHQGADRAAECAALLRRLGGGDR